MKRCALCNELKPKSEFSKSRISTDGQQMYLSYCKRCRADKGRLYYQTLNLEQRREIFRRRNASRRKELLECLFKYLQEHPCVDCGETDITVLEFDHIKKRYKTVGQLIAQTRHWPKVLKEIEKCEVRCANCHRRRHAKKEGWFRFEIACRD